MKILHVTNYYHPHIGGIEQTARDIVNSLPEGAEHKIICFNDDKKTTVDCVDGVEVVRCGAFVKVASQVVSFDFKKRLKKLFKEFNPDTVVFHYPNPFEAHYLLKCLKKRRDCKLIVWWHLDITKQKILGKFFIGQSKRLLNRAWKVIATSPNYLNSSPFLSKVKQKCCVIPSCINEERLAVSNAVKEKAEKIKQENCGKNVCFTLGRHVEYKGYEYLIKASALLDESFKIYIGGKGKLTESLKKQASGDKKIEFLGKISDDDMKAYMLACDVYCFPSITKNEAFGLALAEAMYFGKPAITFTIDGSGVNFVNIKNETGLEVENRNVEKYAEAIKLMASAPDLRDKYAKSARERVLELFTYEKFKNNVKTLFYGE